MTVKKTGLELLEEVLDAYGADRTRWPADVRRQLAPLVSSSPEARRMMAEAEAFDRLLDLAPALPQAKVTALADRIALQAGRTPRMVSSTPMTLPGSERAPVWRRHAAGMASLAASLMIGLLLGQSQTVAPAIGDLASAVGLYDAQQIAQNAQTAETDVAIDEDLL